MLELVVSEKLLNELETAIRYPRLAERVTSEEGSLFLAYLRTNARLEEDPPDPPRRSRDPGDDYLVALAETAQAVLVSGDNDLLALADQLPMLSPAQLLARLEAE